MPSQPKRTGLYIDIPLIDYKVAWDLQVQLVDAKKSGIIDRDLVLMLEHPPVFTLGRRGGRENITVSETFLESKGVPVVHVERGGNITYHGPGQLVVYPIFQLTKTGLDVTGFVSALEEVMIRTAADWGVEARRNPVNRGIWVGNNKLGSIGIAVRRGITFHGFALNVNPDLEPSTWIQPCGLNGVGMTSLADERKGEIPMNRVRKATLGHMEDVFNMNFERKGLEEIQDRFAHFRRHPISRVALNSLVTNVQQYLYHMLMLLICMRFLSSALFPYSSTV